MPGRRLGKQCALTSASRHRVRAQQVGGASGCDCGHELLSWRVRRLVLHPATSARNSPLACLRMREAEAHTSAWAARGRCARRDPRRVSRRSACHGSGAARSVHSRVPARFGGCESAVTDRRSVGRPRPSRASLEPSLELRRAFSGRAARAGTARRGRTCSVVSITRRRPARPSRRSRRRCRAASAARPCRLVGFGGVRVQTSTPSGTPRSLPQ